MNNWRKDIRATRGATIVNPEMLITRIDELIEAAERRVRLSLFALLHEYAMKTTDAKTLDLIEEIQRRALLNERDLSDNSSV